MPEFELPKHEELEEHKEKAFTRRVALLISIFGMMLALTSLGGATAGKEMLLNQQKASNHWAYYQAKAMRQHLYQQEQARLQLELASRSEGLTPGLRQQYEQRIKLAGQQAARYRADRDKLETEARALQDKSSQYREKDHNFEFALALLQLAIVLASVAILANSRPVVILAMVLAGLGGLGSLNGFLNLFTVPFFH